jgi:hypothetical protein
MHPPVSLPPRTNHLAAGFGVATIAWAILLLLGMGLAEVRAIERAGGGSATGFDKLLHFIAFAILGTLTAGFVVELRSARSLWVSSVASLVVCGAYAVFHEGI